MHSKDRCVVGFILILLATASQVAFSRLTLNKYHIQITHSDILQTWIEGICQGR
jgi:hypothetical protein